MDSLKQKTLGLFMTRGLTLARWAETGILTREAAVYNELARHFGRIRIFTYGDDSDLAHRSAFAGNVEIIPARIRLPKLLAAFAMAFRLGEAIRGCDCLKSNQMFGALAAVFAGRVHRRPVIVRTGYTLSKFLKGEGVRGPKAVLGRLEERLAYRHADAFIVSSAHDFEYVVGTYRLDPARGLVVPNYIDTGTFRPLGGRKDRDVLFVGRFTAQKNLESLLEALRGTGLKATLVGGGELEGALRARAAEAGLEVEWAGSVPNAELPRILDAHRMFVLPSRFEGMPKSLLEAMSCAMPVVGTDVEGTREVIEHGVDGLLATTEPASIREAVLRLAGDAGLRESLGRNARAKIEAAYSLRGLVEREAGFYRRALFAGEPA